MHDQRTQRMPHVLLAVLLAARTYRTSHAHAPTLHGAAKSGDVQGIQALLGARPELSRPRGNPGLPPTDAFCIRVNATMIARVHALVSTPPPWLRSSTRVHPRPVALSLHLLLRVHVRAHHHAC